MGKSEEQLKKRVKEVTKSPISPMWLGESCSSPPLTLPQQAALRRATLGRLDTYARPTLT